MAKNTTEKKYAGILSAEVRIQSSPFVRHGMTSIRAKKHARKRTKKARKNMRISRQSETNNQIRLFEG